MIGFYRDQALTILVTESNPKQMVFPLNGLTKQTTLYLGDPDIVDYTSVDNIVISIAGANTRAPNPAVSIALGTTSTVGLPGVPLILSTNMITGGITNAIPIHVQITLPAGLEQQFSAIELEASPLFEGGNQVPYVTAAFNVIQWDQGIPVRTNLLPLNRQLLSSLPGFVVGQYLWRNVGEVNALAMVPTMWDPNVNQIGTEKFIYGVGQNDNEINDLGLIDIEEPPDSDSINPRVNHGTFWTGYRRYFLPADDSNLEFVSCGPSQPLTFVLQATPRTLSPIFVGTWALDDEGFYEYSDNYRYMGLSLPTPTSTQEQFSLVRSTKTLTLNQGLPIGNALLGVTSGQLVDYFQLPIHPIAGITNLTATGITMTPVLNFNQQLGTLSITWPSEPEAGIQLYITYNPAVAIWYETGVDDGTSATESILADVELSPAFSGVARGYLYLQNARQLPYSISLTADKPPIALPGGLTANGPIYYIDDFALLTATVYGEVPNEVIPGVTMKVVPGPGWKGLINYLDPTAQEVTVLSGGDGVANLVYTPPSSEFGVWLDPTPSVVTTNVTGDTIDLPEPVPIDQFGAWDVTSNSWNWALLTYSVEDDNPLLGMVGANTALGQVPWTTSGTPGTSSYQTNGQLNIWENAGQPIYPIAALDIHGNNLAVNGGSGDVVALVYPTSLPTAANIGAYFISYILQVSLILQDVNSNVQSNILILQMQTPTIINGNIFLILAGLTSAGIAYATTNSVLNLNRLALASPATTQVELTPRF